MSLKWIGLLVMAWGMIGLVSCGSNCPDTVEISIDASKDTILAIGSCKILKGAGQAALTVKGYQDDSSGFIIHTGGPLNESAMQFYSNEGVHYKLSPDSVWLKQDWFDSYYDTLFIIYRHKLVTRGKLDFTIYYPTPQNQKLLSSLYK